MVCLCRARGCLRRAHTRQYKLLCVRFLHGDYGRALRALRSIPTAARAVLWLRLVRAGVASWCSFLRAGARASLAWRHVRARRADGWRKGHLGGAEPNATVQRERGTTQRRARQGRGATQCKWTRWTLPNGQSNQSRHNPGSGPQENRAIPRRRTVWPRQPRRPKLRVTRCVPMCNQVQRDTGTRTPDQKLRGPGHPPWTLLERL